MAQIRLRFVTDAGPISGLIRWFTDFSFSHVEFVLDEDWLPYIQNARQLAHWPDANDYGTIGARFEGGIQLRPSNYSKFTDIENVYVEVTDVQKQAMMKAAVEAIGTPYDVINICGIVFRQNWHEHAHEICSVFCTQILNNNGAVMLRVPKKDTPSITPRDLYLSPLFVKA